MTPSRAVIVHPDATTLAHATAARFITAVLDAQSFHRPVHVVLTGGELGIATLTALAENPAVAAIDWTGVHVWWGDERFLDTGDPERNETAARAALLDHIDIPGTNVHPIAAANEVESPEAAAAAYQVALAEFSGEGAEVPDFDVMLLGMGPDGHIASLFPGHDTLTAGGTAVAVRNSPKPPPARVSMTFGAIYSARQVWVVCAGAAKAEAVAAALRDDPVHQVPASAVHGSRKTMWLLDAAAAGG